MPLDLTELAAFAESLADTTGPIARRYFRQPLAVEQKADQSPVTIADREIEAVLRGLIQERYPDHGLFGEEHGREHADRDLVWVLDPIDGTKSFITGMPTFGTLVALAQAGRPILGVIDVPALGERWVGTAGRPSTWNGRPCRTRDCKRLAEAVFYATSPDIFSSADLPLFEAISRAARMRRFGGDCYSYALLAGGQIDLVVEASMQPYDYMALVPVIEGAGGTVTDWQGRPLDLASDGKVVAAATPELHAEVIGRLRR